LFLDEIEALSPKGQVVLLRFLQDRMYRPLGGSRLVDADVRVIAASNADLEEMVARHEFRADLMYRLTIMPLHLPPLRERRGDVPLLAQHFVNRFNTQYERHRQLTPASLARLEAHAWPGNVRELENLLHRAVLLSESDLIDLPPFTPAPAASPAASAAAPARPGFERGFRAAKASWIDEFERTFVSWALAESGGNVSAAARRAGKERRSFSRLIKKHGLDRARFVS
jgi:DNA-binding NtrC family response regulator